MKRRTKKYSPRGHSTIGGLHVIAGRLMHDNPLPPERQANVVIAYHTSIDAITGGYAEKTHFDTIVYALNIGSILAQNGIGAEYMELLGPAIQAMKRCKERWLATGRFGLDGDGLQAVIAAAEPHEAQLEMAKNGELVAAIDEMHRRLAA
jgi:hypothetical protein